MISLAQYIGGHANSKDLTDVRRHNAAVLLNVVNAAIAHMQKKGVVFKTNPKTETQISGNTEGGFRPQGTITGKKFSAHKEGMAVDIYDPDNAIDNYITAHPEVLDTFNLYREHPSATPRWCHLTTRAPKSGRRTFYP